MGVAKRLMNSTLYDDSPYSGHSERQRLLWASSAGMPMKAGQKRRVSLPPEGGDQHVQGFRVWGWSKRQTGPLKPKRNVPNNHQYGL